MIRDKIVFSMKDKRIQEHFLSEVKPTFNGAEDICRSVKVTRKGMQTMKKGSVESVKAVYAVRSKSKVSCMGKTCLKCRRKHNFAEMCQSKSVKEFVQGGERDGEQFFVDTLYIGNTDKSDEWPAIMKCKESRVKMKLDTGAATNVTPLNKFRKITKKTQIKPSNTMLKAYGGHQVTHIGKCHLSSE